MSENPISNPAKDQLLALYRTMLLIRRTEEQLVKFYAAGKIYGGVHTYIGEEAVAAGVCAHLRDDDTVFSTHRGHGHAAGQGRAAARTDRRGDGPGHRLLGRPRRLDAPVQARGRLHGLQRHRRAVHHPGGRRRLLGHAAQDRPGERGVLRRRRVEQRRVPRGTQPGRQPGSCRRSSSARTTCTPPRCRCARRPATPTSPRAPRATGCRASRWTATTCWRSTRRPAKRCARARAGGGPTLIECRTYRTRAHAEGMRDAGYRTPGGDRGLEGAGPDQALPRQDAGRRQRDRGRAGRGRRRGQGAGRGGGEVCREQARCPTRRR